MCERPLPGSGQSALMVLSRRSVAVALRKLGRCGRSPFASYREAEVPGRKYENM